MTTAERPAATALQRKAEMKRGPAWSTVTTAESRVAAGLAPRGERTLVGRVYNLILNDFDRAAVFENLRFESAAIKTPAKKNPGF